MTQGRDIPSASVTEAIPQKADAQPVSTAWRDNRLYLSGARSAFATRVSRNLDDCASQRHLYLALLNGGITGLEADTQES